MFASVSTAVNLNNNALLLYSFQFVKEKVLVNEYKASNLLNYIFNLIIGIIKISFQKTVKQSKIRTQNYKPKVVGLPDK